MYFLFLFLSISNHDRGPNTHVFRFLERHGIPYHHLCTTNGDKREREILDLVQNTDFLVLARYMQVIGLYIIRSCNNFLFSFTIEVQSVEWKEQSFFLFSCSFLSLDFEMWKDVNSCRIFQVIEFYNNFFENNIFYLLPQVLSGNFLENYGKDIINIHHGLLPSFKGGNPSRQVRSFCLILDLKIHPHPLNASILTVNACIIC